MVLFLDESGTDHGTAPYEVTGGIAIRLRDLWDYVQAVGEAQRRCFGGLVHELAPKWELKGAKLLARDKFRKAAWRPAYPPTERCALARRLFAKNLIGDPADGDELAAFGQACLAYCGEVLETASRFDARVFASVVEPNAPQPNNDEYLRRDQAFLFERYYYYLDEFPEDTRGLLVFDELERMQCRKRLRHIADYFCRNRPGRERSGRIIPEPFFVHSDLTTGTQTADLVIYIINWAYRFGRANAQTRPELSPYARQVQAMVYRTVVRGEGDEGRQVWGVTHVDDLRPASERP